MFEVNSRSSEEVRIEPKNCNTMSKHFLRMDRLLCIMLDHHWIAGSYPKEDFLQENLQHKEEDKRAFFTAVSPLTHSMLNSSRGRRKAENDSLQSEAGKSAHYNFFASILKLALVENMGKFWATNFQMPSLLHKAVPADCCVRVVTGNRADILYQRGTPEPREAPRVAMQQAHHPAWRDPSRNLSQDGQTPRTLVRLVSRN